MNRLPTLKNRHPFIVVEGIDGVGKTTVSQLVAKLLYGEYYKTPSAPFDSIRSAVDKLANPQSRFYFYVSAVFFAAAEIARILEKKPVVCDRYIYSTYAYHFTMDPKLCQSSMPLPTLVPDVGILLIADENARMARLAKRRAATHLSSRADEQDFQFLCRVNHKFLTMPLRVINTSNRAPELVAAQIATLLSTRKIRNNLYRPREQYEHTGT